MLDFLENKRVLFVTTKNLDYIRNTQEIELLKEKAASLAVIGSYDKSYIKRLFSVFGKLLKINIKDFDISFVGFSPQLIVPFWKKLRKKELAIDFFISLYDTFVWDRKKFKDNSLLAKYLKALDRKTLKAADYIVTDTKAHGRYFAEELGADAHKEYTLYLKANRSIYYPREQKKTPELQDKFVVLYFGSILPLQGISVILDAVHLLRNEERIYFYIVGPVNRKDRDPLDNVSYFEWLSQEELAEKISQADLCLAGHFNDQINKAKRTIPGKAYIYRAMKKPMILGDNPANHELFDEKDDGIYYVKMGDSKALAEKILELSKKDREKRGIE